jgi:UDP-N-acetylmuramoyl-tripeptide--D-alanyl-D-alanine ligase
MGMNHSGELTYLSNIAKPNIATINNIMLAHAGHFNDLEDIAKAKGEIEAIGLSMRTKRCGA